MALVEVQWSRLAEELFDLVFFLEHPLQPIGDGIADDEIISAQWQKVKRQVARVAAFIPQEPDIPDCKSWEHAELERLWGELQRLRETCCMEGDEPFYMRPKELGEFAKSLRRFLDDGRNPADLRLIRYMPGQPMPRLRVVSPHEEPTGGEPAREENQPAESRATHSDDYTEVCWFGERFTFTKTQAACVRVLWDNWERGTPTLSQETILTAAGSESKHLKDLFRSNEAWGKMIVQGDNRGTFRLKNPE